MKKTTKIISVILCVLLAASVVTISASAKKAKKYVKSIKVSKKATLTIPASKSSVTKAFKVTVKVSGKASKKFTAKSSNASVAAVKVKGSKINVTAKKAGTAKIKVTTKAKNKKKKKLSKTLTVTVKKAAASNQSGSMTPVNPNGPSAPSNPTPSNPTEPSTPATPPRSLTLSTALGEVKRMSMDQDEFGNPIQVEKSFVQAKSTFSDVPISLEELKALHKADPILPDQQDAALESSEANGRFEVVALYFAALKAYDPKNPQVFNDMMEELCESPTAKLKGHDIFTSYSRSNVKDNFNKTGTLAYKYKYIGNSYFDGAESSNGYTPSQPYSVTLEDYIYSSMKYNDYQTWVYQITSYFKGADTPRTIQVYQDTMDGKWYLFSDSWLKFTSDIKEPALSYIAKWQNEG